GATGRRMRSRGRACADRAGALGRNRARADCAAARQSAADGALRFRATREGSELSPMPASSAKLAGALGPCYGAFVLEGRFDSDVARRKLPLVDRRARELRDLRISVTDR